MLFISIKETAKLIGVSERTLTYQIAALKKKRKFKKQYLGRLYTIKEAQKIIKLLGLQINLIEAKESAIKSNKRKRSA